MDFRPLSIAGAFEVTPRQYRDSRGIFAEGFRIDRLAEAIGHELRCAQTNISVSTAGALRGIHYSDVPPSQAKYVTATSGVFIDFVVDVRVGSPTYGQWDSVRLDTVDRRAVYLSPRGSVTRWRASRTARRSTCAQGVRTQRVSTPSTRSTRRSAWACLRVSSRLSRTRTLPPRRSRRQRTRACFPPSRPAWPTPPAWPVTDLLGGALRVRSGASAPDAAPQRDRVFAVG